LEIDWNWSGSWEENSSALPNRKLLNISRLSIAIFLPVTILLYYVLTKKIFGFPLSALSTILLMTNSIILLHTRRAMAETGLLFFLVFSLLALIKLPNKYLFLSAVPIALGMNTKQSLLPLLIVGFVFIAYVAKSSIKSMVSQISLFLLIIVSIFYILNPVIWEKPIATFSDMLSKRAQLTTNQMNSIAKDTPTFILNNPIERLVGIFGQLFVVKPATQDIANYDSELQREIEEYNKNILHSGFGRNILMGAIVFIFFCIGVISEFTIQISQKMLVFSLMILFFLEIFFFFPIPFQRYYIPLFPFSMLYISSGIIRSIKYSLNIVQNLKINQKKNNY
jgi:4-amino-4-deoxy-L-arabinose transferase-like glycosyltransferase